MVPASIQVEFESSPVTLFFFMYSIRIDFHISNGASSIFNPSNITGLIIDIPLHVNSFKLLLMDTTSEFSEKSPSTL